MDIQPLNRRFTKIYQNHADAIFRFCLLRVADREQALDITEETFVRLWQTFIGQRGNEEVNNPKAFLLTVAQRLIIDWYRKKKTLSLDNLFAGDDDTEKQNEPADVTTTDLNIAAEGRFILERLNDLDEIDKNVIRLRFVEGLSPPEIGAMLGISANATSVRINRGLKRLRNLTGYGLETSRIEQKQHHEKK